MSKALKEFQKAAGLDKKAGAGVRALQDFAAAASKLLKAWDEDEDKLNENYPEGFPDFTEMEDKIDTWARKTK